MGTVVGSPCPKPAPTDHPSNIAAGADRKLESAIERFAIPIAILITVVAFLRYAAFASRRLWFDEVYTFTVATQPHLMDIWRAFYQAVDLQPPLFYFVTRMSWLLFGHNELALRLPEILGVLVFSWCIFLYVGKRLGLVLGLSAMILSLVNDLEFYSGQARPYGMLLAACGLTMLAWRQAIELPRRRFALPVFAALLAITVSLHALAIVAVGMFGIAELLRYFRTRRPDWRLWSCFLIVIPPFSLYWFPYRAQVSFHGVFGPAKQVHWRSVYGCYEYFFHDRIPLLMFVGILFVALAVLRRGPKPRVEGMPFHELALAGAWAASPFFCVILAMFVTHYYWANYTIYAVGGAVILTIAALDAIAPSRRVAGLMLLLVSFVLFGLDQFYVKFNRQYMKQRDIEMQVPYPAIPPDAPLVIASGLAMLPTDVYASDADLARTYYLMGRESAIKYTGSTVFEFGPPFAVFHHFRLHLTQYSDFVKEHKKFYVYGPYHYADDWQIQKLIDDGARIVEKGRYHGASGDDFLLEVEFPH